MIDDKLIKIGTKYDTKIFDTLISQSVRIKNNLGCSYYTFNDVNVKFILKNRFNIELSHEDYEDLLIEFRSYIEELNKNTGRKL